jgi:hypothetical protein
MGSFAGISYVTCQFVKDEEVLICTLGQCATRRKARGSRPNEVIECYQFTLFYRLATSLRYEPIV